MKLLLLLLALSSSCLAKPQLRFKEDGTFRMIQFTDQHFGEHDGIGDDLSHEMQQWLLSHETPDLVVLSGDVISGYGYPNNHTHSCMHKGSASCWEYATRSLREKGYLWATTFGNHDSTADLTREELAKVDMSYANSLTEIGPSTIHHVTNYQLPIYDHTGQNVLARLWMFDTGASEGCLTHPGYSCIWPDQVAWYKDLEQQLQKTQGRVMSVGFMHIPAPEYMDVYNNFTSVGYNKEDICCWASSTGFVKDVLGIGTMSILLAGHDHKNDWVGAVDSLTLGYGRKTGYGGYPPEFPMERGARVVELRVDENEPEFGVSWATWIRRDDGTKEDHPPVHFPTGPGQTLCKG